MALLWCFLINFGHIWHLVLVSLLLKLNMYLLAGDAITLAAGSNHRQNFIQICWKGVIYIPCIAQKSAEAVHLRKKFSPQKSLHFAWWQLSYGNAVLKNFINLTEITHDGIFSFKSFRLKGCWVTIKCLCVRLFLLNFFSVQLFFRTCSIHRLLVHKNFNTNWDNFFNAQWKPEQFWQIKTRKIYVYFIKQKLFRYSPSSVLLNWNEILLLTMVI